MKRRYFVKGLVIFLCFHLVWNCLEKENPLKWRVCIQSSLSCTFGFIQTFNRNKSGGRQPLSHLLSIQIVQLLFTFKQKHHSLELRSFLCHVAPILVSAESSLIAKHRLEPQRTLYGIPWNLKLFPTTGQANRHWTSQVYLPDHDTCLITTITTTTTDNNTCVLFPVLIWRQSLEKCQNTDSFYITLPSWRCWS